MRQVMRTNDPVRLSWAQAVLRDAGLNPVVLDTHASVMDGSLVAIPRRLMLPDDEADRGLEILAAEDPDRT